jgi:hypothetical protein
VPDKLLFLSHAGVDSEAALKLAALIEQSPDGHLLAAGTSAAIHLWSTDLNDVFRRLCLDRGRNLSLTE